MYTKIYCFLLFTFCLIGCHKQQPPLAIMPEKYIIQTLKDAPAGVYFMDSGAIHVNPDNTISLDASYEVLTKAPTHCDCYIKIWRSAKRGECFMVMHGPKTFHRSNFYGSKWNYFPVVEVLLDDDALASVAENK